MTEFTNLSAYKFTPLAGLADLRSRLRTAAQAVGLKGTVLLSSEGINLFIAGPPDSVAEFLAEIRAIPGLADLSVKQSMSATQPFDRMLVAQAIVEGATLITVDRAIAGAPAHLALQVLWA